MTAILYPVAASAEAALARPSGRAARERDAAALVGDPVAFVTEPVGPAFRTREAALDAYAGRVDDERPGHGVAVAPEDRYCALAERFEGAPPTPVEPAFAKGRRWPKAPGRRPVTVFRLTVSYWKVGAEGARDDRPQPRQLRRKAEATGLSAAELRTLAQQPLRPVRPQQPLDIGLFEAPAPEAPHILIPDE